MSQFPNWDFQRPILRVRDIRVPLEDDMGLAFYANAVSFLVTALLISSIKLPENARVRNSENQGVKRQLLSPIRELKEGWQFAFINPVVRTVNAGLATAMLGAGMVIPLGVIYTDELLGAGEAQETRRILDRIYGFELSNITRTKVGGGASAGRVQSPATRLVIERERERMKFITADYWGLKIDANTETDESFSARLLEIDGLRIATGKDFNEKGNWNSDSVSVLDEVLPVS